jgi:sec-independent protein translocase protein TatB
MFDFAASEIAVIGIVALVLIGPREMPVAIRAVARMLKKVRNIAGEFQHHVDQMVRDADLGDVQSTVRDLSSMNLKQVIADAVDHDGSFTPAFDEPLVQDPMPPTASVATTRRSPPTAPPPDGPAPSFVPPIAGQPAFASAGR